MEDEMETTSLRQRLKKSSITICCCFQGSDEKPSPIRSPSTWIRSRFHNLLDIKRKHRTGRYRRLYADFSYDPLSYALNFDDGPHAEDDHETQMRDFSQRLLAARNIAPPPPAVTREILVEIS